MFVCTVGDRMNLFPGIWFALVSSFKVSSCSFGTHSCVHIVVVCLMGKVNGPERLRINECLILIGASHRGASGLISANFWWDSCLKKWYWSWFYLSFFGFPLRIYHTIRVPNSSVIASGGVRWADHAAHTLSHSR
jgi:hypothetical protein